MDFTPELLKNFSIFFPYAASRTMAAISSDQKFVHYCDADAAMSMLRNNEVWMRKTTSMNDYLEIEYGLSCLAHSYQSEIGNRLKALIEPLYPGLCDELARTFDSWQKHFRNDTYITSLTEQGEDEEEIGRLSMWRAYAGTTAVAMVVHGAPFLRPSDALKAYSTPVAYLSPQQFEEQFGQLVSGIEANQEHIRAIGRDDVFGYLFAAFRYAALGTKHRGFREEREWRIFYQPSFEKSERLVREVRSLRGRPQTIYKIPLKNVPEEGLYGIEIPELLDRVIVGPGNNQRDTRETFITLLEEAGVPDPAAKVWISDTPLRAAT